MSWLVLVGKRSRVRERVAWSCCPGVQRRGRQPGLHDLVQQLGHPVAGVSRERSVQGEVGEGPLTGAPGGEREQARRAGDQIVAGAAGQVAPQRDVMRGGVGQRPGVVADRDVQQQDGQERGFVVEAPPALLVVQEGVADRRPTHLVQRVGVGVVRSSRSAKRRAARVVDRAMVSRSGPSIGASRAAYAARSGRRPGRRRRRTPRPGCWTGRTGCPRAGSPRCSCRGRTGRR